MKYFVAPSVALPIVISIFLFSSPSHAISSCNGHCQTLDDCAGQLICINGRCRDDPDVGTHTCSHTPSPSRSSPSHAISSCNDHCHTLDDCAGQLICINGRCNDDPDVGTHICSHTPSPSGGGCRPSGTTHCHGESFPQFHCSPLVTSSTRATLTNNDFSEDSGGEASECDGKFHKNSELIVALSTGWYAGGSRCGDRIKITSTKTGRSVMAKVVDECDSINGCDAEHEDDPPCGNHIVDGSNAVWHALGLDIEVGEEDVTWSMA